MCCCGKSTINGTDGYKWQPDDAPMTRPVNPPELREGDTLLYDEPGRCGGLDSHSHHFRVVRNTGAIEVLVRHGGGDERFQFGWAKTLTSALAALDSNGRYWMLQAAHSAWKDAASRAQRDTEYEWRKAAAEKRIKTRKYPARGAVRVWIEDATASAPERVPHVS